jgi:hypothetical protein
MNPQPTPPPDAIKAKLTLTLCADGVEVAVTDDPRLWSFVLGAILLPPAGDLPPLPAGFLPPGYRSYP